MVKATAKPIALQLVADGYKDSRSAIACPSCSQRYLLLVFLRDGDGAGHVEVRLEDRSQRSLTTMLRLDHLWGHHANCLIVPDALGE